MTSIEKENLIWSIKNGDLETVTKFIDAVSKIDRSLNNNKPKNVFVLSSSKGVLSIFKNIPKRKIAFY